MAMRKCGAFLVDGSGEHEMSFWSVLTNTHKPPVVCDFDIRRSKRRYRKRIVIEEITKIGPSEKPSMLTRLRWLASFGSWGGPGKSRQPVPVSKPLEEPSLPPPPPTVRPTSAPTVQPTPPPPPPPSSPPPSPPPPPPPEPTVNPKQPAGPSILNILFLFLLRKQYLFYSLPIFFLLPVAVFFGLRALYKRFIRRYRKRYRKRIRYVFITAIFSSFCIAIYKILMTFYEIVFI